VTARLQVSFAYNLACFSDRYSMMNTFTGRGEAPISADYHETTCAMMSTLCAQVLVPSFEIFARQGTRYRHDRASSVGASRFGPGGAERLLSLERQSADNGSAWLRTSPPQDDDRAREDDSHGFVTTPSVKAGPHAPGHQVHREGERCP
jgi:hypothetical protein